MIAVAIKFGSLDALRLLTAPGILLTSRLVSRRACCFTIALALAEIDYDVRSAFSLSKI